MPLQGRSLGRFHLLTLTHNWLKPVLFRKGSGLLLLDETLLELDFFDDELFTLELFSLLLEILLELDFLLDELMLELLCLLLEVEDEVDELSECGITSVEFIYVGSSVTVT